MPRIVAEAAGKLKARSWLADDGGGWNHQQVQIMKQRVRTALLTASALLMMFGAVGNALIVVPDLHGDLIEIGVRPSVLGGTVMHLYFAVLTMFGFAKYR